MTNWTPTHYSKSDGSTARLVTASPFTLANECDDRWEDNPDDWATFVPDDDEEFSRCEQFGHDDEVIEDDEFGYVLRCNTCGAEWWEDYDEA